MTTEIEQTAWYLRCRREDVAARAILVGDRGRVLLAANLLDDARMLNEDRGLTTATGTWRGIPVTISAFGMGAAIATVVLHELVSLGVTHVVRLGTVLGIGPTHLGDLVLADSALRGEGTSGTYVPQGYPAAPDLTLTSTLMEAAARSGRPVVTGMIGSFDGFYSELFTEPLLGWEASVDIDELVRLGVVGLDMESSAVLAVGRALGARAAVLCLASVDGRDHSKLEGAARTDAEEDLLRVGLDALVADAL